MGSYTSPLFRRIVVVRTASAGEKDMNPPPPPPPPPPPHTQGRRIYVTQKKKTPFRGLSPDENWLACGFRPRLRSNDKLSIRLSRYRMVITACARDFRHLCSHSDNRTLVQGKHRAHGTTPLHDPHGSYASTLYTP